MLDIIPMPPNTPAIDFAGLQKAALARHDWPTAKTEGWQFTRLAPISQQQFTSAIKAEEGVNASPILTNNDKKSEANQFIFTNGILQATPSLSTGITLAGINESPSLLAYLTQSMALEENNGDCEVIADLAVGHAEDIHVVTIKQKLNTPITLSFDYSEGDTSHAISSPAVIIFDCEADTHLTILEQHHGSGNGLSLPFMLFRLAKGSSVTHSRRLLESDQRSHLGLVLVDMGEGARYHAHMLLQGNTLARSETRIAMNGEDGDALLNTIYMARDKQMHDITSCIDHNAAHCLSFQRVHGIVAGQAKSVFQGKVKVARGAQKTDGNQMSRSLLLSRECEVSTKPELEIYADDVACSHGATLGEIDDGQLFYLKSRGIPHNTARQMLIVAFLEEVLEAIEDDTARHWLTEVLDEETLAEWCAEEDTAAKPKPSTKGRSAA